MRLDLTGDELEQRRLADAVASDETGTLGPEMQVEIGKSGSPSGADHEIWERVMDAGMDMDFPVGKANWRCDRVEIHCGTHPVEMVDGR